MCFPAKVPSRLSSKVLKKLKSEKVKSDKQGVKNKKQKENQGLAPNQTSSRGGFLRCDIHSPSGETERGRFPKRPVLISEAPCAYSRSASRLFPKRLALILEAHGVSVRTVRSYDNITEASDVYNQTQRHEVTKSHAGIEDTKLASPSLCAFFGCLLFCAFVSLC